MSKLRLNLRQWLALGFAVLVPATCAGCSQAEDVPAVLNSVGYANVCPITGWNVDENSFAVFDIGDHNSVETHFQDRKLELCNEEGMCVGVIISTDAEDEAAIYDDVEYAKSIVRDYEVKFPVYLNIDKIITNDNLNNEMKTKLIKNFLEKCSANNMYVALHGTDSNLRRVKEYCGITGFDALVVKESDEILYDGSYSVYQELDGTFVAKVDLEEIILGKGLNDSEAFANDGSYTIKSESELTDIALQCGMSVNELLEFNNLTRSKISKAIEESTTLVIRIPSQIDTSVPQGEVTYKRVDTPIRGCDMSYAQGTNVQWDKMSEYFDFIILRSNIGLTEDDCFATNAKQASLENISIGAYCYNAFDSTDVNSHEEFIKKQEQQADYTLSVLKNKKIEYPVYLDVEGVVDSTTYKKEDVQAMLDIWVNKMSLSGYIPGLYCNQSTFRYLQGCVDYDLSDRLQIWVAGGNQYSSTEGNCTKHDHLTPTSVTPSDALYNGDIGATMGQSTNICIVEDDNGDKIVGDTRGHMDINYSLVDYSDRTYSEEGSQFPIKEFDRTDGELIGMGIISTLVLGAGTILGIKIRNKVKSNNRPKVKSK